MPTNQSVLVSTFWKRLQWSGNREGTRIGVEHAGKTCLKKVGRERESSGNLWITLPAFKSSKQVEPFSAALGSLCMSYFLLTYSNHGFGPSFNNLIPYQWLSPTYMSWQTVKGFLTTHGLCDTFHRYSPLLQSVTRPVFGWLCQCHLNTLLNTFLFPCTDLTCLWKKAEPGWWQQAKLRRLVFLQVVEIVYRGFKTNFQDNNPNPSLPTHFWSPMFYRRGNGDNSVVRDKSMGFTLLF